MPMYGALGVLNPARTGLEQFLTVGLSKADERAIGLRPTGRGVLGLLITDPAVFDCASLAPILTATDSPLTIHR